MAQIQTKLQDDPDFIPDDPDFIPDENEESLPDDPETGQSIWDKLSSPLTNIPSRFANSIADFMTPPSENGKSTYLDPKSFGGRVEHFSKNIMPNTVRFMGQMGDQLTSPVDIAANAATFGTGSIASQAVRRGIRIAGNSPMIASGLHKVFDSASSLGDKAIGGIEALGGGFGAFGSGATKAAANVAEEAIPAATKTVAKEAGDIILITAAKIKNADKSVKMLENERVAGEVRDAVAKGYKYVGLEGDKIKMVKVASQASPETNAVVESIGVPAAKEADDIASLPDTLTLPAKNVEKYGANQLQQTVDYWEQKGFKSQGVQADGSIKLTKVKPTATETPEIVPAANEMQPMAAASSAVDDLPLNEADDIADDLPLNTDDAGLPIIDKAKPSRLREAYELSRGILSSMDISAPGRQGLSLIMRPEYWKSIVPMVKSLGSEKAFRAAQESIMLNPNFKLAKQSGLYMSDLTKLSKREEVIMSTWAEKIPGVRGSNRAYTAFLNKLRFDSFNSLMNDYERAGINLSQDPAKAKALANFLNTATGRGSLNVNIMGHGINMEKAADALNTVFYSPRLVSSRIRMYNRMLNPVMYWKADPIMRKEALKALIGTVGAGASLGQVAKLGGASVGSDSTSADFGKIRVGNTRVDPFAGYQQIAVMAGRSILGQTTSTTSGNSRDLNSGPMSSSIFQLLERYGISKLHPVAGFIVTMLDPEGHVTGHPMKGLTEEIARRYIPIIIQDIHDVAQDDPSLLPFTIPTSAIGMGQQTYGNQ